MQREIKSTQVVERNGEIILFALASDGTLWRRNARSGEDWVLVKNIPQSTPDNAHSYKEPKRSYKPVAGTNYYTYSY